MFRTELFILIIDIFEQLVIRFSVSSVFCGLVAAVPVTPQALQDSQLFDAEYSEPLLQRNESHPVSQHALLNAHTPPEASTPPRARQSTGPRHQPRGTEENVLFGVRFY